MQKALILIDLQNDYFPGGAMELINTEKAGLNAQRLLKHYRTTDALIVHIQHISTRSGAGFFLPGTPGVDIHKLVAPLPGETVIQKNYPNSFRETPLFSCLQENNVTDLIICGAMSHMCIDATTRAAFDLGFRCIIAEDACTTRDLQFKDRTIKAKDVQAAFMAALAVPYAAISSTGDILS